VTDISGCLLVLLICYNASYIVRKLGRTGTPLFLLAVCQTQGTRPSTLCTAFFIPSWSREDVKYTSWTCLPARARSVNLLSLAGTLESQSSKSCETTRFSNTWRPNCTSVIPSSCNSSLHIPSSPGRSSTSEGEMIRSGD